MTTYRLFPATSGPSAAAAYSGPFQAGVAFKVTADGQWLDGYWWWCCNTGQQVTPVTAALWEIVTTPLQVLVPASSVTSGTLTPGQWNYIPLPAPIALSKGVSYVAVIGYQSTTGFPFTANQFGSGQPFSAGITNGPLTAYSDVSGSNPAPASQSQGLFGTGATSGASASANYPSSGSSGSANFWVDVQIDSVAPAGAAYQIWPSQPYPINQALDTANNFTLGTEFTLSQPCALDEILFYSPATVTQLPTECGIWQVSGQSLIAATHLTSPAWSGAAGSGWVSVSYSGVILPAGDYKVSVFNGAGSPAIWNAETSPYWSSPGAGSAGITTGPLSAPNNASATAPGQSTYHLGATFAWPDTYAPGIGSATYWVDVLVTPVLISGSGSVALAKPSLAGVAVQPPPQGSWWGLHSVLRHSRQEFDAYVSRPPVACPRCGEPLINAPTTASGSGKQLFCKFDGWSYPRDWHAPTRYGPGVDL